MEADFRGYATKAGLKCSDGRTIMPDAFKHQDTMKVPLVWQHGHTDPENVLGHAILENRPDGVYCYGFFNDSPKATHIKRAVKHKDITMLSIWANDLVERAGRVLHGAIREVSLVLSGANPGAVIENVTIRHSDDDDEVLADEAIIYTGLTLEHSSDTNKDDKDMGKNDTAEIEDEETVQAVYDSMSDKQQQVLHYMLGEALGHAADDDDDDDDDDETVEDVYNSMSEKQKKVLHFMVGEAIESAGGGGEAKQDNMGSNDNKEGNFVKHNIFENDSKDGTSAQLSHDAIKGIVADAVKTGSLKDAVEGYALAHGIDNIDLLFPDARAVSDVPEWVRRRTEWVDQLLQATRKSPFSRIKTLSADITMEDARARGYIKGNFKKEEFFSVSRRVTTPQTIYKKQKLDRDDVIDITDFDVVAWLKAEMRIMLDEEIARAILIGDGRDVSSEDKISETNIRPIARDHELYTTTLFVNVDDPSSSVSEIIDTVILNRHLYKGTGSPTFFTTESWIARFLLLKDTTGRRIYKNLDEVATDLRVSKIVPVELMEEEADLVGILVNPVDYVVGADRGGQVSLFDDFDIDYNQQKYLIETRISGALVKLKSAIVVRTTAGTNVLATPPAPAFDPDTGALTITDTTGVVYRRADTNAVINAAGSPYTVDPGDTLTVTAEPAAGYYFASSENDAWDFEADA